MKNLIVLATALVSANSFAAGLIERAPQIPFAAGEATTFVAVTEVCFNGEEFETVNAKPVFAHVKHGKEDSVVVVGSEILKAPRTYTTTISYGKDGRFERTIEVTRPLNYSIEYVKAGKETEVVVKTASFTVPACN